MPDRKKLIEVALPLEEINKQSAREKSIRHGHPSTLHLWWARRPLASCRAVLFASLVDDPSARPEEFPTEEAQAIERKRLLELIEKLVAWENVNNQELLAEAQAEILKSTNGNPPPVLDPFCGGGSIPLEVQRLGLEAHASDINPVAVLITKALIEIPPKFKDMPPVNPEARGGILDFRLQILDSKEDNLKSEEIADSEQNPNLKSKISNLKSKISNLKSPSWFGAQGLAEDVRYYGKWIRDEAEKRIGHLYPKVKLPKELGEGETTVIAWLWARTVKCPNPTCGCQMPLVKSFELSTKKGKAAWVEPVIDRSQTPPIVNFTVKTGEGKAREGTVSRRGAICIACDTPMSLDYVRAEGKAKRMSAQLMAIVTEGRRERVYISPSKEHEEMAFQAQPEWKPEIEFVGKTAVNVPLYGMNIFGDLFTPRQLVSLTTLCDLVSKVKKKIKLDAIRAGMSDGDLPLREEGTGAEAYADAVAVYLGLGISKLADASTSLTRWKPSMNQAIATFARQALPMVWDYAESNAFNGAAGDYMTTITTIVRVIHNLGVGRSGKVKQQDATKFTKRRDEPSLVFTTDPPYYDNISYAELADFFYVWLRRSLNNVYPQLFATMDTPKEPELVYAPYRFGGDKEKARQFFEEGLQKAFRCTYEASHPEYPFTVFYAFKQTETDAEESENGFRLDASTGWETMLESLLQAGFSVTGTWPMRTELGNRPVASGANALASSIALVCRPLPTNAPKTTRRDFLTALKRELPSALRAMQQGNIAPVDLAQASIGPGMAVFSRYKQVLESDGSPMRVRTALQLINQTLDEYLTEQEGELDADTRWALTWFEQHQFEDGNFGDAETLSKAKVTSIQGLVGVGIVQAKGGKVRLVKREEILDFRLEILDSRKDNLKSKIPNLKSQIPDWFATQHLIKALLDRGEDEAAILLNQLDPDRTEIYRDLAYRLYNICDRKSWTQEAIAYNSLVISWAEITRLATTKELVEQGNFRF